ncbi:hypothetical protein FRB93_010709 [Tulasnella sp. JGI-2019a]|nr:hypothetical protein FRB93_010709 [Tulasnella sp. JGI-2019a]
MKRTRTAEAGSSVAPSPKRTRIQTRSSTRNANTESIQTPVRPAPHRPTPAPVIIQYTATLHDLPAELLYEIQLLSLSPTFPYTSRHIYTIFRSTTPHYRAQFILASTELIVNYRHMSCSWTPTISCWLRFGICNLEVFKILEKAHKPLPSSLGDITVRGIQLPKRLSRKLNAAELGSLAAADDVLPLLKYLFTPRTLIYSGFTKRKIIIDTDDVLGDGCDLAREVSGREEDEDEVLYTPYRCVVTLWAADANSNEGYALTKAVSIQRMDVVTLLLMNGARPTCKGNLPIRIALGQKNFKLAAMLLKRVERGNLRDDQGLLNIAVKCGAREVVDLLKARGVVPDMGTVRLLMKSGTAPPGEN